MDPPVILIQDWSDGTPVTELYICGENELKLENVYKQIARLRKIPGRGHLKASAARHGGGTVPRLVPCTRAWADDFFQCVAYIVDYLADFFAHDTVEMQSIWFHFLDQLQDIKIELPHKSWQGVVPFCDHSHEFGYYWESSLALMNKVLLYSARNAMTQVNLPSTVPEVTGINTGKYKAGLSKWQQFLLNHSPGFSVSLKDRVYYQNRIEEEGITMEQHLPTGALAIIQKHTNRARSFAVKLAQSTAESSEEGSNDRATEILAEFDANSIDFINPRFYTTIDGRTQLIQQMHPKGPQVDTPMRSREPLDEDAESEKPTFQMLNEHLARLKRSEGFKNPRENNEFEMWTVTSSAANDGKGLAEVVEGYHDMFDEWAFEGDDEL